MSDSCGLWNSAVGTCHKSGTTRKEICSGWSTGIKGLGCLGTQIQGNIVSPEYFLYDNKIRFYEFETRMPWFGSRTTKPKDIAKLDYLFDSQFDVEEDSDDNER